MNVTFKWDTSVTRHGVYLVAVKGKRISPPALVYRSEEPGRELAVHRALESGLLTRITNGILTAGG